MPRFRDEVVCSSLVSCESGEVVCSSLVTCEHSVCKRRSNADEMVKSLQPATPRCLTEEGGKIQWLNLREAQPHGLCVPVSISVFRLGR